MIEVGKKYAIVNSIAGNEGKIVTVTGYAGTPDDIKTSGKYGDRWFVDRRIRSYGGKLINHVGERQLRKIDDDHEVVSWESMKDIWVPDTTTA